jgi:hypothetical protein
MTMAGADFLIALAEHLYDGHATRKPDHYFEIFASYFDRLREQPIDVLELGVHTGASLLIWREYFPKARIVGLDVRDCPPSLEQAVAEDRISFIQGDQSNPADLRRCLDLAPEGKFDIIIDDASHQGALSRASFDFLFPHGLKDKGLYFIEDFGASYSPYFGGADYVPPPPLDMATNVFPSHDVGMVGWIKQLFDEVTVRLYFDTGQTTRPMASCHIWPNLALVQKL